MGGRRDGTVLGPAGREACVLTLLFRKSNHMLAFILPKKTSSEVARAFLNEKVLGLNEYRSMPRDKVNLTPGLVK